MFKFLLISIPFLFVIGSLFHYFYKFSKNNKLVGLIAPINESIFEHTKLLLYPLILFWVSVLFVFRDIKLNSYFLAMLVSIVMSIVTMVSFFYTYKGIIGKNYLVIDIFDLLISLIVGQILANHVYMYSSHFPYYFSLIIIVGLVIIYCIFTYHPLKIPFFLDNLTKTYGIKEER